MRQTRFPESGSGWLTLASLARLESVKALRHPALWLGLLLATVSVIATYRGVSPVLQREVAGLSVHASPLAAGVLYLGHLAASRSNRDRVVPLVVVSPTAPSMQTMAMLVALLPLCGVALSWVLSLLGLMWLIGGVGSPHPADVLATPGIVLLAGSLGVLVGRWLPSRAAPAFLIGAAVAVLWPLSTRWSTTMRLLPWADWFPADGMIEMWPRQPFLKLGFVLALSVAIGLWALATGARQRSVTALALVFTLAAVHLASVLTRPWADADLVADMHRHTVHDAVYACAPAGVHEFCHPEGYSAWRDKAVRAASRVTPGTRSGSEGWRIYIIDRDAAAVPRATLAAQRSSAGRMAVDPASDVLSRQRRNVLLLDVHHCRGELTPRWSEVDDAMLAAC